jgi:transglutaminase-like putative cysteine protease
MRFRREVVFAALLLAAGPGSAVRAEVIAPLFEIPVDPLPTVAVKFAGDAPWRIALDAADPPALMRALNGHAAKLGADNRITVNVGTYVAAVTPVQSDWLAPTFVIDYKDAPVPELSAQLRAAHAQPQPADVVEFVAATVKGSHDRGFDLASRVAQNRRGDCTEFAVLTAALARSAGLPARVVLGVALVADNDTFGAYGHAWAEIDGGSGWQVADAALAPQEVNVRYLALGVLDDEGPGYMMSVARPMHSWVRRVSVLAPD